MFKAGVIGATGYTGEELLRIVSKHPQIKITLATSETFAGKKISEIFPGLEKFPLTFQPLDDEKVVQSCEAVFCCLPHKEAMRHVPTWIKNGLKVVDLSADFRLHSASLYEQWYQRHTAPELLNEAVYGLPEFHREKIKKARLVANPGCYPTGALLGLVPLLKKNLIATDGILIDSKSGMSGAGRKVVEESLKIEAQESVSAYKVGSHRHTPEIEQELSEVAGKKITVTFTPHLMPMHRGILSTIYGRLHHRMETEGVLQIFHETYRHEPFIKILTAGQFPKTKEVSGTNQCLIAAHSDLRTGHVIVVTAIDNLVKGASGQAVQNMNLMCGVEETTALS